MATIRVWWRAGNCPYTLFECVEKVFTVGNLLYLTHHEPHHLRTNIIGLDEVQYMTVDGLPVEDLVFDKTCALYASLLGG